MPNLDIIPVPRYQALSPYNYQVDNLPIDALGQQIFVVNSQVDIDANILRDSIGTAGTLANRLAQSINDDGSLKTTAVDATLHSIAQHLDGNGYVRMTTDERSKLSLIQADATNLSIQVQAISSTTLYPQAATTISIQPSPTITWRTDVSGNLYADSTVALTVQAIHQYDVTPVTSNGINFTTTSIATPYKAGTLRVYVNGLRLTKSPTLIGGYYYTETTPAAGTFSLSGAIGSNVIRIDFDQPLQ